MTRKSSICSILGLLVAFVVEATAQSPTVIGFDSSTSTQYECIRFPNPKLNFVRSTIGAKQRSLKIKAAKSSVNGRIKNLKARKKSLAVLLKDAVRDEKKLLSNPLFPLHAEKLVKIKEKISTLSEKAELLAQTITNLKELLTDINDCSKGSPPDIGGSVQILSGLYNGGTNFYVIVGHIFEHRNVFAQKYCGRVQGNNKTFPGWSQVLSNEPPILSGLTPTQSPCSRLGFSCLDPSSHVMFVFAAVTGIQSPGSCLPPFYCSLDQAVADAKAFFGGISVSNVAPFVNQNNCF